MCEIFFLYGRNGQINPDSLEKLLQTALNAADRNSDGFGIFNDKKQTFKTAKKLKNGHIPNIVNEYANSKFVVVHLRLATNGSVCQENSHPFTHNNNIMVHNGVVRRTGDWGEDNTDSYEMMRDILDNKEDGKTVEAIEDTMNDLRGRVSVFLHDENHNLYYFRETSTFTFAHNPVTNEYVGATLGKRLTNIWDDQIGHVGYFDNLSQKEPEEGNILKITDENIEKVGEFDMSYTSYKNTGKSFDGHPRRGGTTQSTGKNKTSTTSSNQTNPEDEEINAANVLPEEELNDSTCTPLPTGQGEGFSEKEYQRQKAGMTEDEWEDFIQEQARKYAPEEETAQEPEDFAEMYNIENDYQETPETISQEVYEHEPEPKTDEELAELDEQEYWEQKEQEFFNSEKQEERYEEAVEEFDAEENPLDSNQEEKRTVKDAVEQDIAKDAANGLAQLFEGSETSE